MKWKIKLACILYGFISCALLNSQNETSQWYFGKYAGLSFLTSPPTVLSNGALNSMEACASISDGAGNLLFYTDATTIWDQTNGIMANGSGLLGHVSATQGAIIVKQPGSVSGYFIFTLDYSTGSNGLRYSIVDMSLAAGMGSVTIKNVLLQTPSSEKLTAILHCNRKDVWVISHDNNNIFRAFQVTSASVNTTAIVSSFPNASSGYNMGYMRASHDGKKIGLASYANGFEFYDFDNATGNISNRLVLLNTTTAYGCEFSADDSKFYGSTYGSTTDVFQWDLCQNSWPAVQASQYAVSTSTIAKCAMQLAPDGKIYVARPDQLELGIIHNPNAAGPACNYSDHGLAITSGTTQAGLPNFLSSYFFTNEQPFVYSVTPNCSTSFSLFTSVNLQSCMGSLQPNGVAWDFGDLPSGAANTSTVLTPTHHFSAPGNYTVQVIRNYNCYSDTLKQNVNIAYFTPSLSIAGRTLMCNGETNVLTASGADVYNWSTASTSASIVITPTQTASYTYSVTGTNTLGSCSATQVINVHISGCSGIKEEFISSFKIFPNPTKGILNIETAEPIDILIYNQFGETVLYKKINVDEKQIDLQKFPDGIYFIKTNWNSGVVRYYKILKNN